MAWALGLIVAVILAATAATTYFRNAPADLAPLRFSIAPPDKGNFALAPTFLALSPDGRMLALIASDAAGKSQLWIRSPGLAVRAAVARDRECQPTVLVGR